jgi:hypothetical protein
MIFDLAGVDQPAEILLLAQNGAPGSANLASLSLAPHDSLLILNQGRFQIK